MFGTAVPVYELQCHNKNYDSNNNNTNTNYLRRVGKVDERDSLEREVLAVERQADRLDRADARGRRDAHYRCIRDHL